MMKKKFLSIILVLSMLCAFMPVIANAATSGTCGDNVTWTLDDNGTLTISGTGKMKDYDNDTPWNKYRLYIKSAVIEKGVTSIGDYAFFGCNNITNIIISESVTTIGNNAFGGCNILKEIVLPNGITSIGDLAFNECRALESIGLPDNIENISDSTFSGCRGLKNINANKTNKNYCSVNGVLFNKDISTLIRYPMKKENISYIIPDSVIQIGDSAFGDCDNLTNITIPNSVTNIGRNAFGSCSKLESIIVGNSVTSIAASAFWDCIKLESINLPDSVTSISANMFANCSSLKNITIPNNVTTIEERAFSGSGLTSVTIPDSVTRIDNHAFNSCKKLETIKISKSIENIGDNVFDGCSNLTSIIVDNNNQYYSSIDGNLYNKDKTKLIQYAIGKNNASFIIPNGVTNIGDNAFDGCKNLTDVTIPNSVTSISYYAFFLCKGLTSITIPDSVTSIGVNTFMYCNNLKDVYYDDTKTKWNAINIESGNSELTNATIHYNGIEPIPTTTATVTKSESETTYNFDVAPEAAYANCYVYAAVYDESGVLLAVNRVPMEITGSTSIAVNKSANDALAKVFVFADTLQPIITAEEFPLI